MDFIVGTFNAPYLYSLHFDPTKETLTVSNVTKAIGGHSWLALSADQSTLYCTAWTVPNASLAAYKVKGPNQPLEFINSQAVNGRPGYVCCSETHVYSVGGATGDVFTIRENDCGFGERIQALNFVESKGENMSEKRGAVSHGDFGGLRHGAHSCDLSPDGKTLYVADIGRNCIWAYGVGSTGKISDKNDDETTNLKLELKQVAPRTYDGPRHTWPHPNGRILYSVQEHSSMIDVFKVVRDGDGRVQELQLCGSGNILPDHETRTDFWADEVRLSSGPDPSQPQYLYASTRGLVKDTNGYVTVFKIDADGYFISETPVDIWQTPTSGGIANAIEPAPWYTDAANPKSHTQFLALTDSEEGNVSILKFDGKTISEVCKLALPDPGTQLGNNNTDTQTTSNQPESRNIMEAATAVWLKRSI